MIVWTDNLIARIVTLHEQGINRRNMAPMIGVSREALGKKMNTLNLRLMSGFPGSKAWNDDDDQILRDGWARGELIALMANKMGRSTGSVTARRRALGLPNREPIPRKAGNDISNEERLARRRKQAAARRAMRPPPPPQPPKPVTKRLPKDVVIARKKERDRVRAKANRDKARAAAVARPAPVARTVAYIAAPAAPATPKRNRATVALPWPEIERIAVAYGFRKVSTHGVDLPALNARREADGLPDVRVLRTQRPGGADAAFSARH